MAALLFAASPCVALKEINPTFENRVLVKAGSSQRKLALYLKVDPIPKRLPIQDRRRLAIVTLACVLVWLKTDVETYEMGRTITEQKVNSG